MSDRYKDCPLDFGHEFGISQIVLPYVAKQRNPVGNLDVGLTWRYKSLLTAWAQMSSTHLEHETRKEQRQGWITGPAEEKAAEETGKVIRVGKKSESC